MTCHADAREKRHGDATEERQPKPVTYTGIGWRNAVDENERGTEKSEEATRRTNRCSGRRYDNVLEKNGDFPAALQKYRAGAAICEQIPADPPGNPFPRAHLVGLYNGVAKMLAETGHIDEAVITVAKALSMMKQLSDANPTNATFREWLAESYDISADLQIKKGNLVQGLGFDRRAQEIFKQLDVA